MAVKKHKKKTGVPSAFNEKLKIIAVNLAKEGKTLTEIAKIFKISRTTLYIWLGKHEDFEKELREASNMADELVEASLFRRSQGYSHPEEKLFQYEGQVVRAKTIKHHPPDVTACIFWLKNRQPERWREKHDVELLGKLKTESSLEATAVADLKELLKNASKERTNT